MPRDGSGVYSLPAGSSDFVPNTVIESAKIDALSADLETDANTARPITAGGTGATTAADARTNLGIASATDVANAFTAASASGPATFDFAEDTDNGTNRVRLSGPASVAADVTVTLPGTADTLVGKATTDTLTNKRVTPRVTTITSSGTPTVNTDNCDFVNITALAAAITSMTTNLSGTPTIGDALIFQILDNGTARAITWGASFAAKGVALPTTTVLSKLLTVAFIWNGSNWGCVGAAQEV